MSESFYRIGIISDTHGVVPPQVHEVFQGVDEIIHAGDIGVEEVLIDLGAIAPVHAVYGNMDGWNLRRRLSKSLEFEWMGHRVLVSHIDCDATDDRPTICITGHTHKPSIAQVGRILYINPGSAGKPPAEQKPSVALLEFAAGKPDVQIIYLKGAR